MKRGRRRLAAFLLALCMALSLTPQALAEEATQPAGDAQALGEPAEDAPSAETAPEPAEDNAGEAETAVEVTFQVKATDTGEEAETPEDAPDAETETETAEDAPDTEEEAGAEEFATLMASNVSYLDENGATKTVASATSVTSALTTWSAGCYVVDSNVTISGLITVSGAVNLILANGSKLTLLSQESVDDWGDMVRIGGINVSEGNSLTIYAQSTGTNMGELSVAGGTRSAGIGGGENGAGGTITINGGAVTANGSDFGAGIGGGENGAGGTITINGGAVTATGGTTSAGIGGGDGGAGGTITINGGKVTANGGYEGAGIGGGADGEGGTITVNGGTVTATGGEGGAGIGGGEGSGARGGTITINGGTVTATGGSNGGVKKGTGGEGGAGIGSGFEGGAGGTIIIRGGKVTANGSDGYGAGIGGGGGQGGGSITISGGEVTATGGKKGGAGIGGGGEYGPGGTITVSGGTVTATGGNEGGAGIGGGSGNDNGNITLSWTNQSNDSITASSYVGTVTFAKDFMIEGQTAVLTTDTLSNAGNKKIVPYVAVTGVTLDQTTLNLTLGGSTATLTATVAPDNASVKTVTWESSDTAVATVSNGVVTPTGSGAATITVSANDNKTATCAVTVHAHNFSSTYQVTQTNAPNDTITATCSASGCDLTDGKASLSIRAPATEAGGAAVLDGDADAFGVSASSVKYYRKSDADWTEISGTPSGTGFFKGSLTIASAYTIEAAYGVNAITIASGIQNGAITAPPVATVGAVVPLTITPAQAWYELDTLTVTKKADNSAVETVDINGGGKSFVMPDEEVTVSATFKLVDYAITLPNDNTVTATVGGQAATSANYNETVTLTVTPPETWQELDTLTVTETAGGGAIALSGDKSFTMPAGAVTVSATFKLIGYDITLPDDNTVTAAVEGQNTTTGRYNDTVTLTVTPAIGYELDTLTVTKTADSSAIAVSDAQDGGKSFVMPAEAVTVSVTFKLADYAITLPDDNTLTAEVGGQTATSAHYNDTVTLKAAPESNYGVSGIEFRDASSDALLTDIALQETATNEYAFSMPARNVKITVTFAELETYTIFFQQTAGSDTARLRLIAGSVASEHDITEEAQFGSISCMAYTLSTARTPDSVSFKIGDGDWTASSSFTVTTDWVSITGGRYEIIQGAGALVAFLESSDNIIILDHDGKNINPDADGSTGVSYRIVTAGSSIAKPSDPTREGYNFVRWEMNGSGEDAFQNGSITVNENTILSAIWEKQTFSVSVDPDNGSSPATSTVSYQGTVTKPSNPAKSGYAFVRWTVSRSVHENGLFFAKGSEFNFNTPVTADLSLKAEWKHVHNYRSYQLTQFPSLSSYYCCSLIIHVMLCIDGGCNEAYLAPHTFDANGNCDCGYQNPAAQYSTLSVVIDDKAPSSAKVKKGNLFCMIAPESVNDKEFCKWQYSSNNTNWQDFSVSRSIGLAVTSNLYLKAVYAERTPEVSISASKYNNNGDLLFSFHYAIPSGTKLLSAGIYGGDNFPIRFMDIVDRSYVNRMDNVLNTISRDNLRSKMLNTEAINIPGYSEPYANYAKVLSSRGNVYMLINVQNKSDYWNKLFFYGLGYAVYQENGERKVMITDPIAVTYNDPTHHNS